MLLEVLYVFGMGEIFEFGVFVVISFFWSLSALLPSYHPTLVWFPLSIPLSRFFPVYNMAGRQMTKREREREFVCACERKKEEGKKRQGAG